MIFSNKFLLHLSNFIAFLIRFIRTVILQQIILRYIIIVTVNKNTKAIIMRQCQQRVLLGRSNGLVLLYDLETKIFSFMQSHHKLINQA